MSVSDNDLINAWKQVLHLSNCKAGDCVTLLTSTNTHPQTLRAAVIALQSLGAIVNTLDLPPVNAD
ncbi:MAG: 2,5-dihydroxypyridine 5,6-dioxygenase, partial [Pseudorhodoplanes sp.]